MPITYPPVAPTLSSDTLTISRFLNSPTLVQRRLNTLAMNRFIADVLLTGRFDAAGGAVLYEQSESIFADRTAEAVEPGAEFPLSTVGTGPSALAAVRKWGLDAVVTDEAIRRQRMNPVERAMLKLTNGVVKQVDAVALAAIAAAPILNYTVATAWATSTTKLKDVANAIALIRATNNGYDPDTLVVDDTQYVNLIGDSTLQAALRREDSANPVYTGQFPVLSGLRVLVSPNLPTAGKAYVIDTKVAGGLADEMPLTGTSIRQEAGPIVTEGWVLRAKRITVPIVVEPSAICSLSSI